MLKFSEFLFLKGKTESDEIFENISFVEMKPPKLN
jgi:hypothetical protein